MQVETLPSTSDPGKKETQSLKVKNVSPVGFTFQSLVLNKVITTIEQVDNFKSKNDDQKDLIDDIFNELVDSNSVKIVDTDIIVLNNNVFETTTPTEFKKYLPEVARQINRTAWEVRENGTANSFLDFSAVIAFPDDPEITARAAAIFADCWKQLQELSALESKRSKNSKVRAVSFAASVLGGNNE